MIQNLHFSEHLEIYINLCIMLLNGQPNILATDPNGCSCNFWRRFASAILNKGDSGTVMLPDGWRNRAPRDLVTVDAWRELIDFLGL